MSEIKKSLVATSGVVLAMLSVLAGAKVRDLADTGGAERAERDPLAVQTLVASRDNAQEVPEADYFYEMVRLLKQEYVEPIKDDQKLATGAIRGMIASLGDPKSVFMDKAEFQAFLNSRQGTYEGIGAEFALELKGKVNKDVAKKLTPTGDETPEEALVTMPRIPRLTVVGLTPGGPAAKAGVKIGDIVYSVDGHWVVNSDLYVRFQQARKDFDAKKIPLTELNKIRKEIRDKTDRALLPLKAQDRLIVGTDGTVNVVWERDGSQRTTLLNKAASTMPAFSVGPNGVVNLRLVAGAPDALKKAISGKREVTLDLRNNAQGDFGIMKECLAILAPKGQYGAITTQRNEKPTPLVVKTGNPSPPKLNLLVDRTTRGAAEILALALSNFGKAKLTGGAMGGDRNVVQIVQLTDGAGYTLVTGIYNVRADKKAGIVAKAKG
jgi:carboxyl-terminal processing protease